MSNTENTESYKSLFVALSNVMVKGRNVLIVLNLLTIVIWLAVYNQKLTFIRYRQSMWKPEEKAVKLGDITRNIELKKYYGDEFRFIDIPFLSTHIYYEDLPVLASLAILIALIWYYFIKKREREIVGELERTTQPEKVSLEWVRLLVFQTIHSSIFYEIDTSKTPDRTSYVTRGTMLVLPIIVLLIMFTYDIYETYFFKQTMKGYENGVTTFSYYLDMGKAPQVVEIIVKELLSLVFIIGCLVWLFKIRIQTKLASNYRENIRNKYANLSVSPPE